MQCTAVNKYVHVIYVLHVHIIHVCLETLHPKSIKIIDSVPISRLHFGPLLACSSQILIPAARKTAEGTTKRVAAIHW